MSYDYCVGKRGAPPRRDAVHPPGDPALPAHQLPLRRRAKAAGRAVVVGAAEEAVDLDLDEPHRDPRHGRGHQRRRLLRGPARGRAATCSPTAGPVGIGLFNYALSEQSMRVRERGQRGDPPDLRAQGRRQVPQARRDDRRLRRPSARRMPDGGRPGVRRRRPPQRGLRVRGALLHGLLGDPDQPRGQPLADDLRRLRARRRRTSVRGPTTTACRSRRRASASAPRPSTSARASTRRGGRSRAAARGWYLCPVADGRRRPSSKYRAA